MTADDRENLLDQIAVAGVGELCQIIKRLECMPSSHDVNDLLDIAEDNLLSLSGENGDY